jgi:hypothetical protein
MDDRLIERALRLARGGYADGGDTEVQSNGQPVVSDGQINWGENNADFLRADAAMRAMRDMPALEVAPRRARPAYVEAPDVPLPPVRPDFFKELPSPPTTDAMREGPGSYIPKNDFDAPAQPTPAALFDPNFTEKGFPSAPVSMGFSAPKSSFGGPPEGVAVFDLPEGFTPSGPSPDGPTARELISLLPSVSKQSEPVPAPTPAPAPPPAPVAFAPPATADVTAPTQMELTPRQRDLIIRTIAAESSGKTLQEGQGIANVILNRIESGRYGKTPEKVLFAKYQFEPWANPNGPNYPMRHKPGSPRYENAAKALDAAINEPDNTKGATLFWGPKAQFALGRPAPKWGRRGGLDIGDTRFHRDDGGEVVERKHHADGEAASMFPRDENSDNAAINDAVTYAKYLSRNDPIEAFNPSYADYVARNADRLNSRQYVGKMFPFSVDKEGKSFFDPTAGIVGSVWSGITAPGDAYRGKVDLQGEDAIKRALDVAGTAMVGGMPAGTMAAKRRLTREQSRLAWHLGRAQGPQKMTRVP